MNYVHAKVLAASLLLTAASGGQAIELARKQGERLQLPSSIDNSLPNERQGPRVLSPEPRKPATPGRPFEEQGRGLADHGISPKLDMTQIYLRNPSTGLDTGNHESLTLFGIGADFDMQKLAGIDGGVVHFQQLYVPWTSNIAYGGQVGGVTVGKPAPYIPKVSHLTLFTYEQRLLEDRLTLEAGKSNAGNYFALPMCNLPFGCVSPAILQDTAGINPPPYANWGLRGAYDFSPRWRAQLGAWRSNNAYPFTNGWERREGDSGGTLSTAYLANLAYRTDFSISTYPTSFELMGFYNNRRQKDPYYTVDGTSRATSQAEAATHDGVRGFYLGAKQTFWRLDGGRAGERNPTALSVHGSLSHVFEDTTETGVRNQGDLGLILSGPFRSRPFDSYSVKASWAQLTDRQQGFLEETHAVSSGGGDYRPGRDEYAISLDANFVLNDSIVLSPFVTRTFGASSWLNPRTGENPRDGYAFGVLLHVQLDQLLGLSGLR